MWRKEGDANDERFEGQMIISAVDIHEIRHEIFL